MSTPTSAVAPPTRLRDVDALRGFALLGIIAVNIWYFADPWFGSTVRNPDHQGAIDTVIAVMTTAIFETKFYLLFSFLFGYSFTLQMGAAKRAGARFVPRMTRRQLGLLGIGLVHGLVLYPGEILSIYAVLGAVLLLLRNLSDRAIRVSIGALVLLAGGAWIILGVVLLFLGVESMPADGGAPARLAAWSGTAAQTLQSHAESYPGTAAALIILQGPTALAAFLLGLLAGRSQMLADVPALLPRLRRFTARYGILGVAGAVVYATATASSSSDGVTALAFGIDLLTAPLLTVAYVSLALWSFRRATRARDLLADAGKIALTNYVMQSLVLNLIFTGYGLGLVNRLPSAVVFVLAVAIFGGQLLLSRWWVRRYRYGPGEWVLRWITIGSRPPWHAPASCAKRER